MRPALTHAIHQPSPSERRRFLRAGAGGLLSLAALSFDPAAHAARSDQAQLLCSGPPGSIPDLICRSVAEQLFSTHGQRVVVDNRPGAAGQLSVGALKAAPADGNTLLLAQGAIATVYPYLYPKLAYDATADLAPVSLAGEMTLALAVGPAVPASVTDVPGPSAAAATLRWTGLGSSPLWSEAGNWDARHVPADGDALLLGGPTTQFVSVFDLTRSFASLSFGADAQACSLHVQGNGATMALDGEGIRNGTAGSGPLRKDLCADAGSDGGQGARALFSGTTAAAASTGIANAGCNWAIPGAEVNRSASAQHTQQNAA